MIKSTVQHIFEPRILKVEYDSLWQTCDGDVMRRIHYCRAHVSGCVCARGSHWVVGTVRGISGTVQHALYTSVLKHCQLQSIYFLHLATLIYLP